MYPINPYALYPNTHSDVLSKEGEAFPRSDSLTELKLVHLICESCSSCLPLGIVQ